MELYNTNRNNMKENSFIKVYWIRHRFEADHDSLWTRNRNISRYQITNLLKTWFLFLVCKKGQKKDKSKFVTKSVGIIVTTIFILKLPIKPLLHSVTFALTSFYYVSLEIWLGNSRNLICIDQPRFYIFSHPRELKNI